VTIGDAQEWMSRLGAIAVVIASLEVMIVHRAWTSGVYRGRSLAAAPVTWLVLILQLAAGLALPWTATPIIAWAAFGATLAIAARWRGSYNGGSDAMLLVVLLAIALARTGGTAALAGLAYAAAQLVLSYFLSGVAKLRDPAWRRGEALPILVAIPRYGVPVRLAAALSGRAGAVAAWAMLGFELAFPLALVDARLTLAFLAGAAVFHFVNAVVFGLNRFLWIWIAAFPALVFWVERLRGSVW
jgi:hypothetical protein